jgi:biopolymer transport protein ExbB
MQSMLSRLIASAALVSFVGLTVAPVALAQAPSPTPAAPTASPAPAPAPAAEAPKPAAPAAKPAASAAAEENPFGFKAMVSHADFVTMSTLIIMIIMSLGSWYIIFTKLWEGRKVSNQAKEAEENFWSAGSVKSGTQNLAEDSPFRFIAEKGVEATQKHNGLLGQIELTDWITMGIQRAIDNISSRMSDGLAFLATVGSTAPFVGLFGTVWGIYNALVKIGISGDASIARVAGPVGEALIMTAIGLAVAVPAVLGYNFIVRKNKTSMDKVRAFGADLHSVLLASSGKKA